MPSFIERVRMLFFEMTGLDICNVEYMEMPKSKMNYNLDKVIGNVNLADRRFRIKSEADVIVKQFLHTPLP